MSEKNPKPVELTDNQLEQVSGGTSMLRSQTVIPSQNIPTRLSTASNVQRMESDKDQEELRRMSSSSINRPRPRN